MMTIFFVLLIALSVAFTAFTKLYLMGSNLSLFDKEHPVTFKTDYNSQAQKNLRAYLNGLAQQAADDPKGRAAQLAAARERVDRLGLDRNLDAEFIDDLAEIDGFRVPGQWTLVKGHDPDRRILYMHGGAFTLGSPLSHRAITYNIAKRTGCAIFVPKYRLIPENPRLACVEDARASYKWILQNGPNGPSPVKKLSVAGDSAGGNLALNLSNYARDEGLRQADAVIGLSPATDTTFGSPSLKENLETDLMLKPMLAPLLKIPRPILLWMFWLFSKAPPKSPLLSPLQANLSGLPPTLIQATTSEMLYSDSLRYVNKAQAAGSPVKLQSWDHLCHVWHIADDRVPDEAEQAFDEIAKFLGDNGVTH